MAFGVGLFFGTVLKQLLPPYEIYLPHVLVGLALWWFVSATINESATVFSRNLNVLRYAKVPFEAFVKRIWLKHGFVLLQNIIVVLVVMWTLGIVKNISDIFWAFFGISLMAIVVLYSSQIIALLCARFRDLPQTVSWLLNLGFLLTPIIWMSFMTGRYEELLILNPFHHLLEVVRLPILQGEVPVLSFVITGFLSFGLMLAWRLLWRWASARLPYWI